MHFFRVKNHAGPACILRIFQRNHHIAHNLVNVFPILREQHCARPKVKMNLVSLDVEHGKRLLHLPNLALHITRSPIFHEKRKIGAIHAVQAGSGRPHRKHPVCNRIECLIPIGISKLVIDPLKIAKADNHCRTALVLVQQILRIIAEFLDCPHPRNRVYLVFDPHVGDKPGKKIHLSLIIVGHVSFAIYPDILLLSVEHPVFHVMIRADMVCHILKILEICCLVVRMNTF